MRKLLIILMSLPFLAVGQERHAASCEDTAGLVEKIYYARDVFIATDEDREGLKELVFDLRADTTLRVHVRGYADRWGSKEVNDRCSYVRAMYIADWIRSCKVPSKQIEFSGGSVDTLAINDKEARRVEVWRYVISDAEPTAEPEPIVADPEPVEVQPTTQPEPEPVQEPAPTPAPVEAKEGCQILQSLYVRTNLLYFAMGLFNAGVEYKESDSNFGYLINAGYSPFGGNDWKNSLGGWFVSPEVRYYIPCNNKWFVGVQFLAGGYNIKLTDDGYQGSVLGGGVLGGYRLTLKRGFGIDFNLGLGYGSYTYDKYYHSLGVNVLSARDAKRGAIIPQAGVSLIWKIKE